MNSPVKNWREAKKLHIYPGKKGKIVTWTNVFVAPNGFEHEVPYKVAIVELLDGQRITAQVTDSDRDVEIGQKVIVVIRRIGKQNPDDVIEYGIKVKPL